MKRLALAVTLAATIGLGLAAAPQAISAKPTAVGSDGPCKLATMQLTESQIGWGTDATAMCTPAQHTVSAPRRRDRGSAPVSTISSRALCSTP